MYNPQVRDWQEWLAALVPADASGLRDRDREGQPTRALQWLDELACERCDWHPAIAAGLQALGQVGSPLADTALVEFFQRSWSAHLFAAAAHAVALQRPQLASDPELCHGVSLRLSDLLPMVADAEIAAAREVPRDLDLAHPLILADGLRVHLDDLGLIGFRYGALPLSPVAVGCLVDRAWRPRAVELVAALLTEPTTAPDALAFGLYAPIKPDLLPLWLALQAQAPDWLGQVGGLLTGPQLLQRCIDRARAEIATPPPPLPN